eukprot:ctg_7215.g536
MTSDQLHTQFLLQGFDRMGHRRLADAQAIGGAGETLQFGHQGKDFQL